MSTEAPPETLAKTRNSLEGLGRGRAGPPPVTGSVWEMVSLLPGAPTPAAGKSGALVRLGVAAPFALAPWDIILARGLRVGTSLR